MNELSQEVISKRIGEIIELQNSTNDAFIKWLRSIVTVAIGALSLLIPLTIQHIPSGAPAWFYCVSLALMGIGVTSLVIYIHKNVCLGFQEVRELKRRITEEDVSTFRFSTGVPCYARLCKCVGYTTLILGAVSMISFACIVAMQQNQHEYERTTHEPPLAIHPRQPCCGCRCGAVPCGAGALPVHRYDLVRGDERYAAFVIDHLTGSLHSVRDCIVRKPVPKTVP